MSVGKIRLTDKKIGVSFRLDYSFSDSDVRELADGESLIVADGAEYRDCEPLGLPSGTGAIFSEGNFTERETHQDAVGLLRLGDQVVLAVADGISRYPDSGRVASFFVRTSLEVARGFRNAGKVIHPYQVTCVVNDRLRRAVLQGHPIDGITVGSFGMLKADGTVSVHRFGDIEFVKGKALNGSVSLELAPHPNLLPQNVALELEQNRTGGGNYNLERILRPRRGEHRITHFVDGRQYGTSNLSSLTARLSLKQGEWWMAATDGAGLYRKLQKYKAWFGKHPNATPSDLAHFAALMSLRGHDNGSGFVYRHGV